MRRRWLVGAVGVTLVFALLALVWSSPPANPIGPAGYARIRAGMTREQVSQGIGLPPGHHPPATEGLRGLRLLHEWGADPWGPSTRLDLWSSERYYLLVTFEEDGRAVGCQIGEFDDWQPRTPSERLWKWLADARDRLGL